LPCIDRNSSNYAAGGRFDYIRRKDNDRQSNNCTREFVCFSIQHNARSLEVPETLPTVCALRTEDQEKTKRMDPSLQHPLQYAHEGYDMLNRDESWVHHYQPETKHAPMQWEKIQFAFNQKFEVTRSAGKVMFANFQKHGENMNSASYCEVLLKLRDEIRRKHPSQPARYCIMTMPDPIQSEQQTREFRNHSGNFLNIGLTARTWPLLTSICLVR
jgi:hypothetical protein